MGGASSEHNLPAFWKRDLQQHPSVYKKLAENLGVDNPVAKLINKELDKDEEEPASKTEAEFWMTASKNLHRLVGDTFRSAEQLLAQQASETAAWQGAFTKGAPTTASDDEPSGRVDGRLPSLQCGEGNIPLHLKLELAQHLGRFNCQLSLAEAACPQHSGSSFSSIEEAACPQTSGSSFSFEMRAALRSLVSFSLCKGTWPSLELRALSLEHAGTAFTSG